MSFDPKGTEPGLPKSASEQVKSVRIKCPRPGCKSTTATEAPSQAQSPYAGAPHTRVYRCVECGNTWGVNTGGYAAF